MIKKLLLPSALTDSFAASEWHCTSVCQSCLVIQRRIISLTLLRLLSPSPVLPSIEKKQGGKSPARSWFRTRVLLIGSPKHYLPLEVLLSCSTLRFFSSHPLHTATSLHSSLSLLSFTPLSNPTPLQGRVSKLAKAPSLKENFFYRQKNDIN